MDGCLAVNCIGRRRKIYDLRNRVERQVAMMEDVTRDCWDFCTWLTYELKVHSLDKVGDVK